MKRGKVHVGFGVVGKVVVKVSVIFVQGLTSLCKSPLLLMLQMRWLEVETMGMG